MFNYQIEVTMKKIIMIFLLASSTVLAGTWDITEYLPIKLGMNISTAKSKLTGYKVFDITEEKGKEQFDVRLLKFDKKFWCVPEADSLYKALIENNDSMLIAKTRLYVRKNKIKGISVSITNMQDDKIELSNGAFVSIYYFMTKKLESDYGELSTENDEYNLSARKFRLNKDHSVTISLSSDLRFLTLFFLSEK